MDSFGGTSFSLPSAPDRPFPTGPPFPPGQSGPGSVRPRPGPSAARRPSSRSRISRRSARAVQSPRGTRNPVTPWSTSSGFPPTSVATTGQPGGHGLHHGHGHALVVGGQGEQIGPGQKILHVIAAAQQGDHPLQAQPGPEGLHLALQGPQPGHPEAEGAAPGPAGPPPPGADRAGPCAFPGGPPKGSGAALVRPPGPSPGRFPERAALTDPSRCG